MSEHTPSPQEIIWIGRNEFDYSFGIARFGDRWHGFARGELPAGEEADAMIFFFPVADDIDLITAAKKTVAYAESSENGYGGISRWYPQFADNGEVQEARMDDFACPECGNAFCEGDCWADEFEYGACASRFI